MVCQGCYVEGEHACAEPSPIVANSNTCLKWPENSAEYVCGTCAIGKVNTHIPGVDPVEKDDRGQVQCLCKRAVDLLVARIIAIVEHGCQ